MSDAATAVCAQEPGLQDQIEGSRESFGFYVQGAAWKFSFQGMDFSPEEVDELTEKLDRLRDEPTVSFSNTREAIDYLRSIARRK